MKINSNSGAKRRKVPANAAKLRKSPTPGTEEGRAPVTGVWDHRAWWVAIPLALLVAAAFAPVLDNGFVNWDDETNFLENTRYRGLGWAHIRWAWSAFLLGVYQPLSWMILEAQYVVWGLNPRGYHLTSLLLHAANAVALYVLTIMLLARCRPDFRAGNGSAFYLMSSLAVALFAVHPLRVEVVAWASCQPYLPSALFSMLVIMTYLRAHTGGRSPWARAGWLVTSFLLLAAALLSKAVAISLPLILIVLDIYPLRRLGGGLGRWSGPVARRVWREKIPFIVLSLIFATVALRAKSRAMVPVGRDGIASRIAQACYAACFYLAKTILPWGITAIYPAPERIDWGAPQFALSIVAVAGVSVGLFLLRRRWPGALAVWASYLILLAPNSGLVRVGQQIAADRYSYLATMGWVVPVAAGLGSLRQDCRSRSAAALVGLGLILGLTALTRQQCRVWHTQETLWVHALAHGASRSALGHNNLGVTLAKQNRIDEAMAQFTEALRIDPSYADAHNNLGLALARQERLDEAAAQYAEALRLRPSYAEAHSNLGFVLARQGKLDEAMAQFTEALRLDPDLAKARRGLDDARQERRRAVQAGPGAESGGAFK